ncbi:hypothetical protein WDH52_19155 [Streptomyces sp. TRM70308]|uniref:hypothetical protein n=1 Tax=Streptomyces sp. TRM70308 TaxID=3131932 RepID=UPI003D057E1C
MNENAADLADLLGTQETPVLEFKSTAKREGRRGDAIGKAVCAMPWPTICAGEAVATS